MIKAYISTLLRSLKLIYYTDKLRFWLESFRNRRANRDFKQNNPDVKLPPDYLIYESFQLNYSKYYTESIDTARWLIEHFRKHIKLQNIRILDWGCGPGRIIRHLPDIIGNSCEYFGTDYNKKSIEWCSDNLEGILFNHNSLQAALPYPDNSMDVIYGISIFTHLSEKMHYDWYQELYRILKPGGILFLTTQGDHFRIKLTDNERKQYDTQQLVVRGNVKEGHRTFSAFHPPAFMQALFGNAEVLSHLSPKPQKGKGLPQDIWIIRK